MTGVDPTAAASVALPQASWEGISISFRRWAAASRVGLGGSFNGSGRDTRRGVGVAGEGGGGGVGGGGGGGGGSPWSPSSSPSLPSEPKATDRERPASPVFRPLSTPSATAASPPLTLSSSSLSSIDMEGVPASGAAGGGGFHPSPPDRARAHPVEGVDGEGAREFVPSVSSDQRTPAQRALDELAAERRAGFPAGSAGGAGRGGGGRDGQGGGGGEGEGGERSLPFTCTLRVETNASTHHIPVFVFDGSLHFGLLGEFDGDMDASGGGLGGEGGSSQAVLAGLPPDARRVATDWKGVGRRGVMV